jgi:hypothetical protein
LLNNKMNQTMPSSMLVHPPSEPWNKAGFRVILLEGFITQPNRSRRNCTRTTSNFPSCWPRKPQYIHSNETTLLEVL